MLEEGDPHATGQEEIDRVSTRGADLRNLGGIVGLAQFGVDFTSQLAAIHAFVAGQRVLARWIVGRQDEAVLQRSVIGIGASGLMQVIILPGDVEIVRMTALARQRRRSGIGREVELVLRGGGGHNGHGEVRPDDTGQHIDLFRLDHLVGELHGDLGFALIVLDHDFEIVVPGQFRGQHEAIAHVDAKPRATARKRGDHAHLDLAIGGQRRGAKCCHAGGCNQ